MARQRLDLKAAAEALDTTVDAVRKRVQRGTLESDKGQDGKVYVWLDLAQTVSASDSHLSLLAAKDETIEFLRRELEAERDANRENRRLLAAALERIPAIEAPASPEPSESPETPAESTDKGDASPETERRSWWQRWFVGR